MEEKPPPSFIEKAWKGVGAFLAFIASVYYLRVSYLSLQERLANTTLVIIILAALLLIFVVGAYFFNTYRIKIEKKNGKSKAEELVVETVFERSDCVKFYDAIAEVYDIDNSKEIWITHRAIAKIVYAYASKQSKTLVLDIGGGTGTLLFDVLSLNEKLVWTYVDNSKNMCSIFKRKCEEQGLNVEIINSSFDAILSRANKQYDIVVISFLFSSLTTIPDLTRLNNVLKDGGMIIFADADREYSKRLPYRVLKDGIAYILQTQPWKLVEILNAFKEIGFKGDAQPAIKKDGNAYSHIVIFQK